MSQKRPPTPSCESVAYVLQLLEQHSSDRSKFADAILDFWKLDQSEHRFQIHARVFKGMDLIGYVMEAVHG